MQHTETNQTESRIAIVTGAGSGIGCVASRAFSAQGWMVAAIDRDVPGLQETAKHTDRIIPIEADVTSDAELLVKQVVAEVGVPLRLLNNAGICRTGAAAEMPDDEIAAVFEVNTFAAMRLCKAVVPLMQETGRGQIINLASFAGMLPTPQLAAYAASKAALIAYTDVLRRELKGTGIEVCCVCPPVVETPMVDSIRASAPSTLGGQRGIHPMKVVEAMEHALAKGQLFAFPGDAKIAGLLKRFAPSVLERQLNRLQ